MNKAELQHIREAERQYHEEYFENVALFEEGTWLEQPTPIILELLKYFDLRSPIQVLDLGCGVGRNSIPLASMLKPAGGHIHCVDLLDVAIDKLNEYSQEHQLEEVITTQQSDISEFPYEKEAYHYILAVSCLEHAKSEASLKRILASFVEGTISGGINYIDMNTNIQEYNINNGHQRKPLFEVNLSSEEAIHLLRTHYEGWEELHMDTTPIAIEINRDGIPVCLQSDCLAFAVRKP
ncbi:tellurite resistance protein TehB [compost metagenome]